MKVYICSSWRNEHYQNVMAAVQLIGFPVWNWREPPTGGNGFKWQDAGETTYQHGDKIAAKRWNELLCHPTAIAGFASDLCGMDWCDVGVLLHPCGRSAHLEAGWIAGRGKKVHVLAMEPTDPDLMVLALRGRMLDNIEALLWTLKHNG